MAKLYWWQQNATYSVLLFVLVAGSTVVTNATMNSPLVIGTEPNKVQELAEDGRYDLEEQENLYVDDTYSVQCVISMDKKAKEEEQKRAELEAEEQRKKEAEAIALKTGTSAGRFRVGSNSDSDDEIIRKLNLYYKGSPMAGYGEVTLNAGKAHNINPYLIAAIADTESTRAMFTCNRNNCFGRKSKYGGWMSFNSLTEAIENEASYLETEYVNIGLVSVEQIASKYCVGGNWASKVNSAIFRIASL